MISFILFTTSFALISQTSALVSLDNNNNDPLPLLPASSAPTNHTPNTNTIPNTTTLSLPLPLPLPHPPTTSATISYFCSGPAFGSTLNATSCQAAIHLVGISPAPLTFGLRDTGRAYDVTLPQQYISPDGTCVIEPGLAPGEEEARVSEEDVAVAAFVVVRKCAGTGGVARDIGMFSGFVFGFLCVCDIDGGSGGGGLLTFFLSFFLSFLPSLFLSLRAPFPQYHHHLTHSPNTRSKQAQTNASQ